MSLQRILSLVNESDFASCSDVIKEELLSRIAEKKLQREMRIKSRVARKLTEGIESTDSDTEDEEDEKSELHGDFETDNHVSPHSDNVKYSPEDNDYVDQTDVKTRNSKLTRGIHSDDEEDGELQDENYKLDDEDYLNEEKEKEEDEDEDDEDEDEDDEDEDEKKVKKEDYRSYGDSDLNEEIEHPDLPKNHVPLSKIKKLSDLTYEVNAGSFKESGKAREYAKWVKVNFPNINVKYNAESPTKHNCLYPGGNKKKWIASNELRASYGEHVKAKEPQHNMANFGKSK